VLAALGVIGALLAWRWVQHQIDPPGPPGETVVVEIPAGTSTGQIGRVLEAEGVISNATVWQWYTRVNSIGSIQAGRYELQRSSSFSEAIAVLEEGPLVPEGESVTVPEGLTVEQTLARLADDEQGVPGFSMEALEEALGSPEVRSAHIPDGQTSLEGTLFPETYRIEDGDDEVAVLSRMVAQFDHVMDELDVITRAPDVGLSPYEVLIVASMIEKETRVDTERGKVARVIYNRLAQNEALGIDATSCYPKHEFPCKLTKAELEDASNPYNTRRRKGLPPTPIASPGKASIEAALQP